MSGKPQNVAKTQHQNVLKCGMRTANRRNRYAPTLADYGAYSQDNPPQEQMLRIPIFSMPKKVESDGSNGLARSECV